MKRILFIILAVVSNICVFLPSWLRIVNYDAGGIQSIIFFVCLTMAHPFISTGRLVFSTLLKGAERNMWEYAPILFVHVIVWAIVILCLIAGSYGKKLKIEIKKMIFIYFVIISNICFFVPSWLHLDYNCGIIKGILCWTCEMLSYPFRITSDFVMMYGRIHNLDLLLILAHVLVWLVVILYLMAICYGKRLLVKIREDVKKGTKK